MLVVARFIFLQSLKEQLGLIVYIALKPAFILHTNPRSRDYAIGVSYLLQND